MKLLDRILIKFYYRFWNTILLENDICLKNNDPEKRYLFIYFDYEREFSGHETTINNENVYFILDELEKHAIKSTWFTVGKIFEKYPETILKIISQGHEVGSHSYAHISPFQLSLRELKKDFEKYNSVSEKYVKVKGFHSPNGQWTVSLFNLLKKYAYEYDMFGQTKSRKKTSHFLNYAPSKKILRLITLGDDWPLLKKNLSADDVCNYFIRLSDKLKPGEIAGIGFHPWLLYSDEKILNGFVLFLKYISNNSMFEIKPAIRIVQEVKEYDHR